MVFDSRRRKQVFARHPHIHKNYIGSGRVKLLQQFRIIASFATHCDVGLSLKQCTDGTADGCRIVGYEESNRGSHSQWYNPVGQILSIQVWTYSREFGEILRREWSGAPSPFRPSLQPSGRAKGSRARLDGLPGHLRPDEVADVAEVTAAGEFDDFVGGDDAQLGDGVVGAA